MLKQDGSPPLYYMLLHVWMSVFGTNEARTHALSVLAADARHVPAGLWAGLEPLRPAHRLDLRAACARFNPFLTDYGEETRMYSLLALFACRPARWSSSSSCCAAAAGRSRRRSRSRRCSTPTAWAIFFGVGAFAAALLCYRRAPDRREMVIDGLISFGGAALLFVPWLPTLPLAEPPTRARRGATAPRFGAPVQISRGLMGGDRSAVVLLLAGVGFGIVAHFRVNPSGKLPHRAVYALLLMPVVTLAVAWIASQFTPAWTTRYFGVFLGPLLLLSAARHRPRARRRRGRRARARVLLGRARALRLGRARATCATSPPRSPRSCTRGDLVISGQPEQMPAIAYYFGPDSSATPRPMSGRADPDPYVMDWRDAVDRMKRSITPAAVSDLVANLRPGQHVLSCARDRRRGELDRARGRSWSAGAGRPSGERSSPRTSG